MLLSDGPVKSGSYQSVNAQVPKEGRVDTSYGFP